MEIHFQEYVSDFKLHDIYKDFNCQMIKPIPLDSRIIRNKIIQNNTIYDYSIIDSKELNISFYIDEQDAILKIEKKAIIRIDCLTIDNQIADFTTNADVIIVEKESLIGVLDEDIIKNISQILNGKWIDNSSIHSYKFKLIPFTSLGNENGLLIGFKPDYVKIYKDEEVLRDDVIIGIYDGKLSKTNLYTSLIGLEILKTSKKARETV